MDKYTEKSLLEMANGGFMEVLDYEMSKIFENIFDANTKATAKRKLTLTLELSPDENREKIAVNYHVKASPAPTNPIQTLLYVAGSTATGEVNVVEMIPQIPGQTALDGTEQEAPPMLRLINL